MRKYFALMVLVAFFIGCSGVEVNDTLTVANQVAHVGLEISRDCYIPCHVATYPYLPGVMDTVR